MGHKKPVRPWGDRITTHTSSPIHEKNAFGQKVYFSKEELHDIMWDRKSELRMFKIPREVMERPDISPSDKLVYAYIHAYGAHGVVARKSEIAGITCISMRSMRDCLTSLRKAGLLKIEKRYYPRSYKSKASRYTAIVPPKRFVGKKGLRFVTTDISQTERQIREHFNFTFDETQS